MSHHVCKRCADNTEPPLRENYAEADTVEKTICFSAGATVVNAIHPVSGSMHHFLIQLVREVIAQFPVRNLQSDIEFEFAHVKGRMDPPTWGQIPTGDTSLVMRKGPTHRALILCGI